MRQGALSQRSESLLVELQAIAEQVKGDFFFWREHQLILFWKGSLKEWKPPVTLEMTFNIHHINIDWVTPLDQALKIQQKTNSCGPTFRGLHSSRVDMHWTHHNKMTCMLEREVRGVVGNVGGSGGYYKARTDFQPWFFSSWLILKSWCCLHLIPRNSGVCFGHQDFLKLLPNDSEDSQSGN